GEHGQPALRQLDADVLEVVLPGSLDSDQIMPVGFVRAGPVGGGRGRLAHLCASSPSSSSPARPGPSTGLDPEHQFYPIRPTALPKLIAAADSELVDAQQVAGRVAERTVADAVRLVRGLLHHLGATALQLVEEPVE